MVSRNSSRDITVETSELGHEKNTVNVNVTPGPASQTDNHASFDQDADPFSSWKPEEIAVPRVTASRSGSGSRLCERCKAIEMDDLAMGGVASADESGAPMLSFGDKEWLPLAYRLEDTLPDLPVLKSSADAGCGFCAFLRLAIRAEGPLGKTAVGRVGVDRLMYDWTTGGPGLSFLRIRVRPAHSRHSKFGRQMGFAIEALPGSPLLFLWFGNVMVKLADRIRGMLAMAAHQETTAGI
ncbi:hypothetical protein K490DRAFT_61238 [Saccharata proteae CBS 121410]|uniref:Uncharacterized protein n=1 Tax=Saccharata proteae CBS 121410 TaxID=1314787 RepID=A0A9P4I2H0_9PEZI|nr:hypothetical protein K490DRAFT_61238 [Saccharata proteae CBS 121410]